MKSTKSTKSKLPLIAHDFLNTHSAKELKSVIQAFHIWMTHWKLGFKELRPNQIQSFIRCPRGKELSKGSQKIYRRNLIKYLAWLREKDLLGFDPACLYGRNKILKLPELAAQFMLTMTPTRKKNTLIGYRVALRVFHRWLDEHKISLEKLQRRHTTAWLLYMSNLAHAPHSTNTQILIVRLYLRWLYEQEIVASYPDDLIRSSDLLKEPKYLPRPLPYYVDKELQKRLTGYDDIYSQGLLLMRQTGLRIGEIISLEINCVHRDHLDNKFLKVPLGKLNTERLVPLHDCAVTLIDKLRGSDEEAANKRFLIETKTGRKTRYKQYNAALKTACKGINTNDKIVTHRLRHTYATTLLNAGMSLVSIMKLLGHNDYRMTLRYTAITQETVGKEYFEALSHLEHRYADLLNQDAPSTKETDPTKMLHDLIHLIQNRSAENKATKTATRSIVKRIQRIQTDIQEIPGLKNPTVK